MQRVLPTLINVLSPIYATLPLNYQHHVVVTTSWITFWCSGAALLGQQGCTVVNRWPTACAQANIAVDEQGATYAARFELFVQGVELANAYDECWNADEIRQRFDQDAAERSSDINRHDEAYLRSLEQNPGQVSGVAMGFDRILMLALWFIRCWRYPWPFRGGNCLTPHENHFCVIVS